MNKQALIKEVKKCINMLLYDDVINNTFGCMNSLRSSLTLLNKEKEFTKEEKEELYEVLEKLTSESIREALHKGELFITNGVIREKNDLIQKIGREIPVCHEEIDPNDYPTYNW